MYNYRPFILDVKYHKYIWHTDTHLNLAWPFSINNLVRNIRHENPTGVFITGDISNGKNVENHLDKLASQLDTNIYFVLGNHDYHGRTVDSVHDDMKRLCDRHSNLYWMTNSGIISLTEDIALIGTEGWYDAHHGDSGWIKFTVDRLLTIDFKSTSFDEQLKTFRQMAQNSANMIEKLLEKALEQHKIVYILTHFPPWKEATRDEGTLMENFWLPYNTNIILGKKIEKVMEGRNKKKVIVLSGHTHQQTSITVQRNIECRVANSSYSGFHKKNERIYL